MRVRHTGHAPLAHSAHPAARALRPGSQLRRARTPRLTATGAGGSSEQQPPKQQQQQPAPPPPSLASSSLGSLDLPYETALPMELQPTARTPAAGGLRRAPLSGGVKTATARYDLPAPSVAVRNLVEQAQFAHLCTVMSTMHHRRAGYPFGTLVDFASDGAGMPIFCLSPLAIHARNLIEDPRCSLVVQMPGWTGLANARVTIFGDTYRLPQDMQSEAREIFLAKQANEGKDRWVLGSFLFFRMHAITDIYFVGGFGTVQWVDVAEYLAATPDAIATNAPQRTIAALNAQFAADIPRCIDPADPADEALLVSIDALGADVRVRRGAELGVERLGFGRRVETPGDAAAAVAAAVAAALARG
ncbi:MAG: pyridoxamine 5-phosphate oxidase-like protein [Monoraphidium minutum]|nr:MAG: pyridoxamine 5-phosphate oxidase-like protein [Monoraphidium minutum]